MLDLETEKQTLAKADRDIAEGEERIVRQVELLEKLRHDGHDVSAAKMLLDTLRQTQAAWRDHRDLILSTIARLEKEEMRSCRQPQLQPSALVEVDAKWHGSDLDASRNESFRPMHLRSRTPW